MFIEYFQLFIIFFEIIISHHNISWQVHIIDVLQEFDLENYIMELSHNI